MAKTTIERLANAKFYRTANQASFERVKAAIKDGREPSEWDTNPSQYIGPGLQDREKEKFTKEIVEAAKAEVEYDKAVDNIF